MAQENIDARTLRDMLERGERVTVVDVRKCEDHAEDSIPGSVNFDAYDALHAGDERAMEGLQLPDGARVVTVCNRGRSSAVAAEQLRHMAVVHVDPAQESGEEHHRIAAHRHDGLPTHSH